MAEIEEDICNLSERDPVTIKPQGSSSKLAAHEVAKGVRDSIPSPPSSVGAHLEDDKNMSMMSDLETAVGDGALDHHEQATSAPGHSEDERQGLKATTPPRTQQFVTEGGVVRKQAQPLNVMQVSEEPEVEAVEGGEYLGNTSTVDEEHGLDDGRDRDHHGGPIEEEASAVAPRVGQPKSVQDGSIAEETLAKQVNSLPASWHALSEVLPLGQYEEDKNKRLKLFQQWDPNGNGFLSLAEIDKGVKETSGLAELYKCKPAMLRAYNSAKALKPADPSRKGLHDDDYVSKVEFRMLLVYLKLYFGLHIMFQSIDTDNNRRVDLEEFRNAAPILRDWGCPILDVDAVFDIVDQNQGGEILFDEFAEWAIGNNVLVRAVLEAKQAATIIQSVARGRQQRRQTALYRTQAHAAATTIQRRTRGAHDRQRVAEARAAKSAAAVKIQSRARGNRDRQRAAAQRRQRAARTGGESEQASGEGADPDAVKGMPEAMKGNWRVVAHKLPWRKAHNDKMARAWLFRRWDSNGNGHLSLAEIDRGVKETPGLESLYACKPAMIRAYIAAKALKEADTNKKGLHDDDYVTRIEFRMLLVYLSVYFGLFQIFDTMDTGHDRRVDLEEFKAAAPSLRELGCPIGSDLDAAFARMDKDKGGQILFNEFSEWAIANNILVNPEIEDQTVQRAPPETPQPSNLEPADIARRSAEQEQVLQGLLHSYKQLEEKLSRQTKNWNHEMRAMRSHILVAIENQKLLRNVSPAEIPTHPIQPLPQDSAASQDSTLASLDPVRQPRPPRSQAPLPVQRSASDGQLTSEKQSKKQKKKVPLLTRSASDDSKAPVWRGWDWKRHEGQARQEAIQRTSSTKQLDPGTPRLKKKPRPAPVSKQDPLAPMVFGPQDYRAASQKAPRRNEAWLRRSGPPPPTFRVATTKTSELRAKRAAMKDEEKDEVATRARADAKDRLVVGQTKLEANTERGCRMVRSVVEHQNSIPYEWS